MSSESTNVYRILRKSVEFQPLSFNGNRDIITDFPVICDGKEDIHSWKFVFICSREQWLKNPNDYNYRYTYRLSVSANQTDGFKYERSFYTICVAGDNDQELAIETGDLVGEHYNQLKCDKEMPFLPNAYGNLWVKLTLQSYIIETPILSNVKWAQDGFSDVVIKTKDQDFPCHKFVLATASDYFVKMFEVDMKERQESVINWVGVFEADVVHDFLRYIYTGYTPPNLENTALSLIEMAHMLQMDDFKKLCAHQLTNAVNVYNMGDILRVAAKNESKELQEIAINFITENHDLNGDSPAPWEKVEPEFLGNLAVTMLKAIVAKKIKL